MPCYHPVPARQEPSQWDAETRRLYPGAVTLNPPLGTANLSLPCGTCLGCAGMRSAEWTRRLRHEAAMWPTASFVTLTYSDECFPEDGAVSVQELQRWVKRVRNYANRDRSNFDGDGSAVVRYFAIGEYGDTTDRPHYHAILFNVWPKDSRQCGASLWQSATMSDLWRFGAVKVGRAEDAALAYVAGYVAKKWGRPGCDADGVVRQRPFAIMSRMPPLGSKWLDQYLGDLRHGYLVVDGVRQRIPRTYLRRLAKKDGLFADGVKLAARDNVSSANNDPERLSAAEAIHARQAELSVRRAL